MSKYIATRLHKAIDLAPDEEFFQRCSKLPHYVVDDSLIDILMRSDVQSSVMAMIEAEIAHLPFEELVLEFETGPTRNFIRLEEYQDRFRAQVGLLRDRDGMTAAEVDPHPYELTLSQAGVDVDEPSQRRSHEVWLKFACFGLYMALLMLNIQGVEKEVIEPTKLNKSRVASGKPSVPTHTVMRIGHVYDTNGNRVGYGAGRTMPVHMRAGHARRQHYGEGNAQVKIVYVPPVLVNFKPGAEVKQPKRVLAA